ncbi:MAG: hypothetical protein ACTHLE_12405 [Agriterribacter sp.]
MLSKLDDVATGGAWRNQKKVQMLETGIKNQVEQIGTNRSLKEKAFADMMNSKPGTDEFKANVNAFNEYLGKEQTHTAALGILAGELYKAQKHDDNIKKYNEFVNSYLNMVNAGMTGASIVVSFIPTGGSSAGFFASSAEIRASLFSAKGGYGLFGKSGLKIGGYKIEAMYIAFFATLDHLFTFPIDHL